MARTGRPSKYKSEYCEKLIEHMAEGLSFESFAGVIGTCKQTIYGWTEKHDEFLDAKRKGTEKCRVFWEKLGIDIARGKVPGNGRTWEVNVKNRFRNEWRDKHEISATVHVNHTTTPTPELLKLAKQAIEYLGDGSTDKDNQDEDIVDVEASESKASE